MAAPRVSFEFFPPKTPEAEARLWAAITALASFNPAFVSVTYGAGGTTRAHTHDTVKRLRAETELAPAAHLTCIGAAKAEIDAVAQSYWAAGIRHIVALRGDPVAGENGAPAHYAPHPEGYFHADALVQGLRAIADFEISVAAFPEKHPESPSFDADIEVLARKQAHGATRAISQFFFDAEPFLRLRDRMQKAGLTLELLPGILPISHFGQLQRFAGLCGAVLPSRLCARFLPLDADPAARDAASLEVAHGLIEHLRREGVAHVHFYTLNRADLTGTLCQAMGLGSPEAVPRKGALLSS